MRSSEEVRQDMHAAIVERDKLATRLKELRAEYADAKVAEAAATPHPWAGRKVRRTIKRCGRPHVQTGVVKLCDGLGFMLRNYAPGTGEWYVASASGQTAYRLEYQPSDWQTAWELA